MFFQGGVPVANVPTGPGNSAQVPIPPGLSGTFSATVTPYLGAISGPASAPVTFTIGPGLVPGQPTDVEASVAGATLTVSWIIGSGAAPTSHVLTFFQGSTSVASLTTGASPSVQITIPGGVSGTFTVTVTAVAGTTPGPSSAPASFTIGGCVAPLPVTGLTGAVVAATATVSWNPSPGATSYVVQAGASQGATEFFNGNVGNVTTVSASGLPSGFTAWVRVIAVNACGSSAPQDVFVQ
jgi:predicted phage tail protein